MSNNASGSSNASGSAKVYQFPRRGRYAIAMSADSFAAALNALPANARLVSGNAWYHDAAIQDSLADRGSKS